MHTKSNSGGRWNDRPCEDTNANGRSSFCGPAPAVNTDPGSDNTVGVATGVFTALDGSDQG